MDVYYCCILSVFVLGVCLLVYMCVFLPHHEPWQRAIYNYPHVLDFLQILTVKVL